MQIDTLFQSRALSVLDYRCTSGPDDKPDTEEFRSHSISYVRKGSFGCHSRGRVFEFVPGSLLVGHTGDAYSCTHDHHRGGDECLSFQLTPELVEYIGDDKKIWRRCGIPPLPELMVLGELAWSAAEGGTDVCIGEIGLILCRRFFELVSGRSHTDTGSDALRRKRAIEVAMWIDENSQQALGLEAMAREAGLSAFHFLRTFTRVLGVTPHQYLVRSRLRHAVRLLAGDARTVTDVAFDTGFNDLSNFVRTFRRAAGMSPGEFKRVARGKRNIFQDEDCRPPLA